MIPRIKNPNNLLYLSFEVSRHKHFISRENFTVLDLLGEIGGLQGFLISLCQFVLYFINYQHFDQFMASKLFKIQKPKDDDMKKTYFERSTYFKPLKYRNLRSCIMDTLPNWLKCCKETRQERAIKRAITKLDKEIDIIEMIKQRRFFKMAMRKLFSAKDRMDLKERSRYIMIDPDQQQQAKNPGATSLSRITSAEVIPGLGNCHLDE